MIIMHINLIVVYFCTLIMKTSAPIGAWEVTLEILTDQQ